MSDFIELTDENKKENLKVSSYAPIGGPLVKCECNCLLDRNRVEYFNGREIYTVSPCRCCK